MTTLASSNASAKTNRISKPPKIGRDQWMFAPPRAAAQLILINSLNKSRKSSSPVIIPMIKSSRRHLRWNRQISIKYLNRLKRPHALKLMAIYNAWYPQTQSFWLVVKEEAVKTNLADKFRLVKMDSQQILDSTTIQLLWSLFSAFRFFSALWLDATQSTEFTKLNKKPWDSRLNNMSSFINFTKSF